MAPTRMLFTPLRSTLALRRVAVTTAATRSTTRASYSTKPANPTSQFYKTFTRPVAKVMLLAIFTYQFAYWSWLKLESDEIIAETDAKIADLEAQVDEYKKKKAAEAKS